LFNTILYYIITITMGKSVVSRNCHLHASKQVEISVCMKISWFRQFNPSHMILNLLWNMIFFVPATKWLGHRVLPMSVIPEIKQLRPLFFTMLWDIDLIFGMWVYNDKLQIKFTFRSGPMIFGQVMALGLWNLAKYLVVTTFFRYAWRYWLDFWHESV
jgi:hypothetical protein